MTEKKNRFDFVKDLSQGGDDKPVEKAEEKAESKVPEKPKSTKAFRQEPVSRIEQPGNAPSNKKYRQKVKRGQEESIGKSADPNYDKVTVYIRSDIAHALRVVSAYRKIEMSEFTEGAIEKAVRLHSIGRATLDQDIEDD